MFFSLVSIAWNISSNFSCSRCCWRLCLATCTPCCRSGVSSSASHSASCVDRVVPSSASVTTSGMSTIWKRSCRMRLVVRCHSRANGVCTAALGSSILRAELASVRRTNAPEISITYCTGMSRATPLPLVSSRCSTCCSLAGMWNCSGNRIGASTSSFRPAAIESTCLRALYESLLQPAPASSRNWLSCFMACSFSCASAAEWRWIVSGCSRSSSGDTYCVRFRPLVLLLLLSPVAVDEAKQRRAACTRAWSRSGALRMVGLG